MSIKSFFIKPYAKIIARKVRKWKKDPLLAQERQFKKLVTIGKSTAFGKDHDFATINTYEDFKQRVPIRDYEGLRSYIDRVMEGERDVLWPARPVYLAKTSGTTSGAKYIPITHDSISNHFYTAQTALLLYMVETGDYNLMDGQMIFLSGSPVLEKVNGISIGRLSGIVNHQVPSWLKANQVPSWETNCIDDWEQKLEAIVSETVNKDLTLISGIPPWVQMYFDKLIERTGRSIKDIFPNFRVFVYGGVNYEPYRAKLETTIGKAIPSIETYPASEGFIAFQDTMTEEGLLLNVDSGLFFEFIPAKEIFDENPTRLSLKDVEVGVNYAIIINSNAGLWGYNIGDTVKFVSTSPYRIVVTGRIKHYISAFGEHVIGEEVEEALLSVAKEEGVEIVEFTVAPQVTPDSGLPYHEWAIEFENGPKDLEVFAKKVDQALQQQNIYYKDLLIGGVLRTLKIIRVRQGGFIEYMRSQGKLGGQNKVPRLSNDRQIVNFLGQYVEE